MKSRDYLKDLRSKSTDELKAELAALRKEQFNLRMQQTTSQLSQSNLVHEVRKKIARAKTIMQQQASRGAKAS